MSIKTLKNNEDIWSMIASLISLKSVFKDDRLQLIAVCVRMTWQFSFRKFSDKILVS